MYQAGTIFYQGRRRIGRLQISQWCFFRSKQYGITPDELEEVFRYGREINAPTYKHGFTPGKIEYGEIVLLYAEDETRITRGNLDQRRFVLITCWKGGERINVSI